MIKEKKIRTVEDLRGFLKVLDGVKSIVALSEGRIFAIQAITSGEQVVLHTEGFDIKRDVPYHEVMEDIPEDKCVNEVNYSWGEG